MKQVSIVILAYNEEKHILRCIQSAMKVTRRIVIIDSYSTDDTVKIAKSLGAKVYQNTFINQANQLNWALDNCSFKTEWIFRLDSDEVITTKLKDNLNTALSQVASNVDGLTVNRQIYFLGKWIKWGGIYPIAPLRIWRNGKGRCENRWMDEHMTVEGKVQHFEGNIADINLNNLTWWTLKHNDYASREAIELLLKKNKDGKSILISTGTQAKYKRWIKENIYSHLPSGIRAFAYFIFRYIFMLGFLDGWQGFAFHSLQGLWYRLLVDFKVNEIQRKMKDSGRTVEEVIKEEFGYDINTS